MNLDTVSTNLERVLAIVDKFAPGTPIYMTGTMVAKLVISLVRRARAADEAGEELTEQELTQRWASAESKAASLAQRFGERADREREFQRLLR